MLSTPVQERILKETEQVPANPPCGHQEVSEGHGAFCTDCRYSKGGRSQKIQVPDNLWSSGARDNFMEELMMF